MLNPIKITDKNIHIILESERPISIRIILDLRFIEAAFLAKWGDTSVFKT